MDEIRYILPRELYKGAREKLPWVCSFCKTGHHTWCNTVDCKCTRSVCKAARKAGDGSGYLTPVPEVPNAPRGK